MVMHGEVKSNYEHNLVVMNLHLYPKTADDVILIDKTTANIQKLVGACLKTVTRKLDWSHPHPQKINGCAFGEDRSPDLTRVKPMIYFCANLSEA